MDKETLLQKEIERLNLIINLLIEKNHELERKLQSLSPEGTSSKEPVLLHHPQTSELNGLHHSTSHENGQVNGVNYNDTEKVHEQNNTAYSKVEKGGQPNEPIYSKVKELQQSNESTYSKVEEGRQPNEPTYSKVEEGEQPNQSTYSKVEEGEQSNESTYSKVEELQQSNHAANPASLQRIDVNKVKMPDLYHAIRKKMPHAPRAAAHHVVTMLVHLYQKQDNTHHELAKVAGLTPRGTAKHIMMLKRRGYIVRTSYQQYQLTETALNILREAM